MSFTSPPRSAEITVGGFTARTPRRIELFLRGTGWEETNGFHPITTEPLYYKNISGESLYCTWSEAVAFQYYEFISLGS